MLTRIRSALTLFIGLSLILPFMIIRVASAPNNHLTMVIGRPNIWSLGQAHYLLANLRNANRGLSVTTPMLDPNSVNGARMNVLRTLLGIETQVDTPQALENSVAQQQFQADFSRKQAAIARLDELSRDFLSVVKEISDIDSALAALGPKPADEDKQVPETEKKRDELTNQKAAKVALRDAIAAEVSIVKDRANKDVTLSNAKDSFALGTPGSASLPPEGIGDIKQLIDKMLTNQMPNTDASQRLDNYINMQYELIAKQLTLLRDEISADERLIFLELPSSLYTVPNRDDDKMVHIEWTITELLKQCHAASPNLTHRPDLETLKEAVDEAEAWSAKVSGRSAKYRQRLPITDEYLGRFFELAKTDDYTKLVAHAIYADAYDRRSEKARALGEVKDEQVQRLRALGETSLSKYQVTAREGTLDAEIQKFKKLDEIEKRNVKELSEMVASYPDLLTLGWSPTGNTMDTSLLKRANKTQPSSTGPDRAVRCSNSDTNSAFRVIDVIPRQSALNVNDVHATQKGLALTAKFLTLFGFGGQVEFQRQRSIYEQFLNQEVFASGFGKGTDRFGWTIGPVPGTRRLAPGPRTTFAIVAIPKDAWKITLQATAVAFPRTKDPADEQASRVLTPNEAPVSFDLLVPNENTEGFFVNNIDYTPVRKGQRVTVILGGYFSPLTGVIVNSVPLKRAVAIAKHESDSSTLPVAADSPGEYEYLNSHQMIVSFAMADTNFVGTPIITLVTPEKSSAINFYDTNIKVNDARNESLQDHSLVEPMFLDTFNLTKLAVSPQALISGNVLPITIQLIGSGFRRGADICVNDDCNVTTTLKNTGLYELTLHQPSARIWKAVYRLGQETGSISFDTKIDGAKPDAPSIDSIENPSTGRADGLTTGRYTVVIRGSNLGNVDQVFFGRPRGTIKNPRHDDVMLVEVPAAHEGAVQVILRDNNAGTTNILDFLTPGKAIFKYVKPEAKAKPKPKPKPKPAPQKPAGKAPPKP